MTRRDLTPVIITERWLNPRTGRAELWAAESREQAPNDLPLWTYRKLEVAGTPWEVRRQGRDGFAWYGSLAGARAATADGRALAEIGRTCAARTERPLQEISAPSTSRRKADMDLELSTETRADGVTVVSLDGELDVYTAPRLREVFIELTGPQERWLIVADLTACEYVDSTGLGVLMGGLKRCRIHDGRFAIAGVGERVLSVFRKTGLTKVFGMHATVDEAAASLLAVNQ